MDPNITAAQFIDALDAYDLDVSGYTFQTSACVFTYKCADANLTALTDPLLIGDKRALHDDDVNPISMKQQLLNEVALMALVDAAPRIAPALAKKMKKRALIVSVP